MLNNNFQMKKKMLIKMCEYIDQCARGLVCFCFFFTIVVCLDFHWNLRWMIWVWIKACITPILCFYVYHFSLFICHLISIHSWMSFSKPFDCKYIVIHWSTNCINCRAVHIYSMSHLNKTIYYMHIRNVTWRYDGGNWKGVNVYSFRKTQCVAFNRHILE